MIRHFKKAIYEATDIELSFCVQICEAEVVPTLEGDDDEADVFQEDFDVSIIDGRQVIYNNESYIAFSDLDKEIREEVEEWLEELRLSDLLDFDDFIIDECDIA